MNENEFWVRQIKTLVLGFLAFVTLMAGSCQSTNYQIRKSIEAGAHPNIAKCAIADSSCDPLLVIELEKLKH